MKEAVKDAVDSEKFNGYGPAHVIKILIATLVVM